MAGTIILLSQRLAGLYEKVVAVENLAIGISIPMEVSEGVEEVVNQAEVEEDTEVRHL